MQEERIRLIHDWQKQEDSMAELCRRDGISRRVGYKWLERYKRGGIEQGKFAVRSSRRVREVGGWFYQYPAASDLAQRQAHGLHRRRRAGNQAGFANGLKVTDRMGVGGSDDSCA